MKKTILSFITCAALVCGCASVGNNFDSRKVSEIKKGETTEAELVKMFGQPNQRGVNSESGTSLTWIYSEARVKGETFIPFAGAFVGGATSKVKTLMVQLDQAGKVSSFNYSGGGFESTGTTQADPENGSSTNEPAKSPKAQ
jgi:outer membrane protein assembly factor BamE (lipoprotein component of BamABCDE complex)